MTIVQEYKECVAEHAADKFAISFSEAMMIMEKSGINRVIDEDPFIGTHYAPEEWEENIEFFIRKNRIE